MFDDSTLAGDWHTLANRLDNGGLRRWSRNVPELADLDDVGELLAAWADPERTHQVAAGLIWLAAADGAGDDDAVLLLLHLLSGVVGRLSYQLRDLSPDITRIVMGELTCRIRAYPWRARTRGLVTNLELETRRGVLAELRPSDRYHPDRVERLTDNGYLGEARRLALADPASVEFGDPAGGQDLDLVDLFVWAVAAGMREDDLRLLVASERDRGGFQAAAARSLGVTERHVRRRRDRALATLRELAPTYLAAVA
ncbi:hypothetical protein [uncultured Jatrophihabitans sp.]|uniref:hypothetical protein n=1 Tax=uncultured Jatrophihabitans sp. TaxID=1610747 RepID=UPI0035CC1AFB